MVTSEKQLLIDPNMRNFAECGPSASVSQCTGEEGADLAIKTCEDLGLSENRVYSQ